MCHNPWVEKGAGVYGVQSASPLAVSIAQLNRPVADGRNENQLLDLRRGGWLSGCLPRQMDEAPRFADPYDSTADLNQRARSYLHVNCSHCHRPHAGGAATIKLTYDAKLEDAQLLHARPTQGTFGISDAKIVVPGDPLGSVLHYRMAKVGGGRMPRIGSSEVDERGVAMIHDWIAQMPTSDSGQGPVPPLRPEVAEALASLQSAETARGTDAIRQLISSTRGALSLMYAVAGNELPLDTRQQIIAAAIAHPRSEVRDLFDRFVPASQRVRRLGNVVDPAELLAISADADAGRKLFFQDDAVACKSCHRVNNVGETLGPDLSQIGKKYPRHELLTHLLDPSKFIEPRYVPYVLETVDGQLHTGLLIERNEREVRLRNAQNQEIRVSAADVEILVTQQKSLMPELLLRDLTPRQAADLLAFLCSLK
jgi:putative heme-binding domain-containing protein